MTVSHRRFYRFVCLPLLLLAGLTAWFRMTDADVAVLQQLRHAAGITNWQEADSGFWRWVKLYGVIPAFFTVLLSLAAVFAGLVLPRFAHWLRPGIYLFLVLALGSGVISNLLLKDHWGRPRPMHVIELGGTETFVKILTPAFGGDGKSFPCGHATMGFFFFAVALLLKNKRPAASIAVAAVALLSGGLLGVSRMLQGGHFPSDVLYAAGIMWFTSLGLLYAMRLHNFRIEPAAIKRPHPRNVRWTGLAVALAMVALVAVALVSIPRSRSQRIDLAPLQPDAGQAIEFDFKGSLRIVRDDVTRLDVDFDGCGTPKSRARLKVVKAPDGLKIIEKSSGFFTEKNFTATLRLAAGDYRIKCSPTVRKFDAPDGILVQKEPGGILRLSIAALTVR